MFRRSFPLIALVITAFVFAVACERGARDEDEGNRAAPAATTSTQPPVNLPAGKAATYKFDTATTGNLPSNFISARTGGGEMGAWTVVSDDTTPSKPNVVAQTSTDKTDYRFPMAVLNDGVFKDLELSVKFKPVSGNVMRLADLSFAIETKTITTFCGPMRWRITVISTTSLTGGAGSSQARI